MNESPDTQFERVQASLLADIREGRWRPGDRLPPRRALADHFGVSEATVAWVMKGLVRSGLIVGPAGGAKCVTEEPMRSMAFDLFDRAAVIRRMNRGAGLISPD